MGNLDKAIYSINLLKKLKEKTKGNYMFCDAKLYLKQIEIARSYLTSEYVEIIENYGKLIEELKVNEK